MIEPDVARDCARRRWGQADAIGQVVGGPAIGAIGTAVSLQAALLGGAALAGSRRRTHARGREPASTSDAVPELLEDGGAPDGVLEHPPVTET